MMTEGSLKELLSRDQVSELAEQWAGHRPPEALAAGRLDVSLNFVDHAVPGLMRPGDVEGQMLSAQVRLQRVRIVRTISDRLEQSCLGAAALIDALSR